MDIYIYIIYIYIIYICIYMYICIYLTIIIEVMSQFMWVKIPWLYPKPVASWTSPDSPAPPSARLDPLRLLRRKVLRERAFSRLSWDGGIIGELGWVIFWWFSDDFLMILGWFSDAFLMIFWWFSDDFLMIFWWFSDDFRVIFWCFSDDFLMIFWWFSDDFLMIFWWF